MWWAVWSDRGHSGGSEVQGQEGFLSFLIVWMWVVLQREEMGWLEWGEEVESSAPVEMF